MENRRKIFVVEKDLTDELSMEDGLPIISLRHPYTGTAAKFLYNKEKQQLKEILKFSEARRSWFIDDSIEKDGVLYIITPIDPLFLALPYLKKETFSPLDQLFVDHDFPESKILIQCCGNRIKFVSDKKVIDNESVYRYNEEKAINWLKEKVNKVASLLEMKGTDCWSGSRAATFIQNKRKADISKGVHCYAFGIVCEYLDEKLHQELSNALNISSELPNYTETSPTKNAKKKIKTPDNGEPLENYFDQFKFDNSKDTKKNKLTAAQKKLSKVDKKGMKNISSFFGKT